jgi:outer membrane biosynthesis protein TonB
MVARAPRKRMYRTMQGRMVDIEKLRAANESVQAVGNMKVNARGDVIGPGGTIVNTKENVIKKYYEQPKGMVSDTPRSKPMPAPKAEPVKTVQKMTPVAAKPAPKKTTVSQPQPKKVEVKPSPKVESTPVKSTEKKGIDAALDGLE